MSPSSACCSQHRWAALGSRSRGPTVSSSLTRAGTHPQMRRLWTGRTELGRRDAWWCIASSRAAPLRRRFTESRFEPCSQTVPPCASASVSKHKGVQGNKWFCFSGTFLSAAIASHFPLPLIECFLPLPTLFSVSSSPCLSFCFLFFLLFFFPPPPPATFSFAPSSQPHHPLFNALLQGVQGWTVKGGHNVV